MLLKEFDVARFLNDDETIAWYLTDALNEGNEQELILALQHIAKAKGMTQFAREVSVSRESLYKTLSGDTKPRFETILKMTRALGLSMVFQAKKVS
ncbi:MAG: putative addiction module antidote protein [Alcaligenaceae bacterium]|nr:putative addiction module antidote protein [Alcaligenaceae bacterium]